MKRELFIQQINANVGKITPPATAGIELILDEAEKRNTPINDLAYILATAWWETAKTMQPVREAFFISKDTSKAEQWRKRNLHYYPYYGRGYVQLTWKHNYKFAGEKLGHDFVNHPDLVMDPQNAIEIMFTGMQQGWFSGKSLDDYIDDIEESDNKDIAEYIQARKVINGKDKAVAIAGIALKFEGSLRQSEYEFNNNPLSNAAPSAKKSRFDEHVASLGLKHFKSYELLTKGSQHTNPNSSAYGLNTDPPEETWDGITSTAQILDSLREKLNRPIIMTSVYRSPAYNKAIGGEKNSLHTRFNAIDFSVLGSPVGPSEWAKPLREMRSANSFKGGIGIYSTFVHLDTRGTNADWVG